jgi:hypothetical protein
MIATRPAWVLMTACACVLASCGRSTQAPRVDRYEPPARTKLVACSLREGRPDPACTPGAVQPVDVDVVCHQSTRTRREVPESVHRQAFEEYGLSYTQPRGAFEVDHLIPLELGGDNAIANLWPEAAEPRPGFHEKDRVEDYLHEQVCAGNMSLTEAQRRIASDWVTVWQQIESRGVRTSR